MIRIILFLVLIAGLALGVTWIAERPGEVVMIWQGWRVSTSITVAAVALIAIIVLAMIAWSLLRFVLRSPRRLAHYTDERRQLRGWQALSRGLIAVGTGNAALARRSATEAQKLLASEPLTLLLSAQAAQLGGDAHKAETAFRRMLEYEETKLLGLRGLFIEARRRSDSVAAFALAEEAAHTDPALVWAGEALIEFRSRAGDWAGALEALERQIEAKAVSKSAGKRRRAVLMTAQAQALEEIEPVRARALALDAVRLAPDLVPAVAVAGRLLGADGNLRRAARMIEKAWSESPHPELADAYADLRPGDTARERLQRVKNLMQKTPGHPEGMLAVARAAVDANDFGQARDMLAPLLVEPTQRVCLLMAEIETMEHGDHGKAREWTARAMRARRDPAWVADGYVSERWLPASPLTGQLDAFVWTVPPETSGGPLLEQVAEQAWATSTARSEPEAVPAKMVTLEATAAPADTGSAPESQRESPRRTPDPVVAEPPLPDDPGPEAELQPEPTPQRRRFRLFGWLAGSNP